MSHRRYPLIKWVTVVGLLVALMPVFWQNAWGVADDSFFNGWQLDSQSLVLGEIHQSNSGEPGDSYGLAALRPDKLGVYDEKIANGPAAEGYSALGSPLSRSSLVA